jgi:2-methylisocitrate lyase-like PEP mutase family enzyme
MTFHDLHHGDAPLVLPNAWDVGSALAFIDAGFEAVGTTSFGVGATAGQPDGDRASKDSTVALVHAIRGLPVYVTADIEDGYADDPDTVAGFVADLGAAGINIEDSREGALIDPERHAAKIAAINSRTPEVFVNARVDNYWFGEDATLAAVLERAATYIQAGADGIFIPFVPGALAPEDLARITAELPVPLNILVPPDLTLDDLAELGIRRISTGSLPYRAAVDAGVAVATAVRDNQLPTPATPYAVAQALLEKYAPLLTSPLGSGG